MEFLIASLASFLSSFIASLGLGGGSVFLLYLTSIQNVEQMTAQGLNLVLFIPTALVSLIIHTKNKLVQWKTVLWCVLVGFLGVFGGYLLAQWIGGDLLRKGFAIFLFFIGCREIFTKAEEKSPPPGRSY